MREVRLPYMLSVLAHNNATTEVKGINELQAEMEEKYGEGNYIPPVKTVYWGFRVMVGLGVLFILTAFTGLWLWWMGRLESTRWYHKTLMGVLFLPFIANSAGWLVTEMGRQPWVVYGLLLTSEGVSPSVAGSSIWISMAAFTLVYGFLAAVAAYLVVKYAKPGIPKEVEKNTSNSQETTQQADAFAY